MAVPSFIAPLDAREAGVKLGDSWATEVRFSKAHVAPLMQGEVHTVRLSIAA
jgi:hypothetical protein